MTSSAPRRPDFHHSAPTGRPASTRALAYWESLRDDLVALIVEAGNADVATDGIDVPRLREHMTADAVSDEIDEMKATIRELRGWLRTARRTWAAPFQLAEDRLYEVDPPSERGPRGSPGAPLTF